MGVSLFRFAAMLEAKLRHPAIFFHRCGGKAPGLGNPQADPSEFFPIHGALPSIFVRVADFRKTLHPPQPEQCISPPRYYARCPMYRFRAVTFNTSHRNPSATIGPEMNPKAIILTTMKGKRR